jgi:hypothetical protein
MIKQISTPALSLNFPAALAERPAALPAWRWLLPTLLTECAFFLWLIALTGVDVAAMNDYGLASVLPPMAYGALLLLLVSFALTLHQRQFDRLTLLVQLGTLLFMLYGVTALVEPNPRFHVAWRHIGIIEYISRTRDIDPYINAYFNWPGFFVLFTLLFDIAGIQNPIGLTAWLPLVLNVLYLGPLYMIFDAATDDKRVLWLAIWFFYLANWVGQDYFAPQGFTFFSYLVMLGIVMQWFRGRHLTVAYLPAAWLITTRADRLLAWLDRRFAIDEKHPPAIQGELRAALLTVLIVIYAATVPSHQLTPIFTVAGLGVVILFNRATLRAAPFLMVMVNLLWILFFAGVYLNGHVDKAIGGVGEVGQNVTANVVERLNGSVAHQIVVRVRMIMTLALGLLGALGAWRRLAHGKIDLIFWLLLVAPFTLVLVQPYGGEMILRAYLFALAPMALLAATCFYPTPTTGADWRTTALVGGTTILLAGGFLLARFGNERMDTYTDQEVTAVNVLYQIAEPGSLLMVGSDNVPWKAYAIEQYKYKIATPATQDADVDRLLELMTDPRHPNAYYLLTRSQKAYSELFLGAAPGTWDQTEAALLASGYFTVVYENPDARIFALVDRDQFINQPAQGRVK